MHVLKLPLSADLIKLNQKPLVGRCVHLNPDRICAAKVQLLSTCLMAEKGRGERLACRLRVSHGRPASVCAHDELHRAVPSQNALTCAVARAIQLSSCAAQGNINNPCDSGAAQQQAAPRQPQLIGVGASAWICQCFPYCAISLVPWCTLPACPIALGSCNSCRSGSLNYAGTYSTNQSGVVSLL